jgi:hypothetical protein
VAKHRLSDMSVLRALTRPFLPPLAPISLSPNAPGRNPEIMRICPSGDVSTLLPPSQNHSCRCKRTRVTLRIWSGIGRHNLDDSPGGVHARLEGVLCEIGRAVYRWNRRPQFGGIDWLPVTGTSALSTISALSVSRGGTRRKMQWPPPIGISRPLSMARRKRNT